MEVKINNCTWEIKVVNENKKKMNPKSGRYNLGLTEYKKCLISIRDGMQESLTRETVIHELIHAFIFSFGYEVESEEVMCNFFSAHGDAILHMTDEFMKVVKTDADNG